MFCFKYSNNNNNKNNNNNEIVNNFLLVGDKFMPEIHSRKPGFTYSVCGPFTKNQERIQKFKEKGDRSYIYKN